MADRLVNLEGGQVSWGEGWRGMLFGELRGTGG